MATTKIRLLKASEIECRVGTATAKGFSLLLYKDARVDMNILDETFGNMNWQREHKEIKGNLYCGVSIWDKEKQQWITKWDCGVESNTEKEKGESSDSFKRACFNIGIGRELYTAPFIWINGNVQDKGGRFVPTFREMDVKFISYNKDGEIDSLIINGDGKMIYGFNAPKDEAEKPVKKEEQPKVEEKPQVEVEINKAPEQPKKEKYKYELTLQEAENAKTPRGARLGDLTYEQLKVIMNNDKYDIHIRACAAKVIKELESFKEDDTGDLDF